jgi:hypothetical protein
MRINIKTKNLADSISLLRFRNAAFQAAILSKACRLEAGATLVPPRPRQFL